MGNHPELELITRYPSWCNFGTLTFKGSAAPSDAVRYKLAFAFLRAVAVLGKQPFSRLIWVLRDELGEITSRPHFHVLLGRTHLPLNPSTNFRLMSGWEKIGGGIARMSIFNRALAGAEYVTKCLSGESARGASQYELDKFGWTERPPILSDSLRDYLKRASVVGARPGGTVQVPGAEGNRVRPITGHPITSTSDGLRPRGRANDKPHGDLMERSSLLWRLGRHAYGSDRNGHRG